MSIIIAKVVPILLLMALGYGLGRGKVVEENTMDDLKNLVIKVCIPAVLFITFINISLKREYLAMMVIILFFCMVLYWIGNLLNKIKGLHHPLLPFVTTGYVFGLLGIPLYSSIFGMENLDKISVLGLGHEFFMWFIYIPLVKMKFGDKGFSKDVIVDCVKSPLIISIILGLVLNILGLVQVFEEVPILQGIYNTIEYLSSIATPMILLIIGYGLKFNKKYMKQSVKFIMIRIIAISSMGYMFKVLLIDRIMPVDPLFDYAYFTFLILPPAYALPIFIGEYSTKENKELINNTIVLHTVVCIAIYLIFVMMI